MSDIDILKSFNLPMDTRLNDLHEGTLAYRLLDDRANRPSKTLLDECILIAKSQNASFPPTFAAELYLDILMTDDSEIGGLPPSSLDVEKQVLEDKKYPPRDDTMPDDAMPNIGGGMADVGGGDFKSEDSIEPPKKDCD